MRRGPWSLITNRLRRLIVRQRVPGPGDQLLASYPRSGNTWLRFLVASLAHPDVEVDFTFISQVVPDIHECPLRDLRQLSEPRIIKTHEAWRPCYQRGVYIVRDPRAVLVSMHNYMKTQGAVPEDVAIEEFAARFLEGDVPFGRWDLHVRGWLDGPENVLVVRYEDLKNDIRGVLPRIALALGLSRDQGSIERAILQGSFDRMRQIEIDRAGQIHQLRNSRKGRRFVRLGEADAWRSELPDHTSETVVRHFAATMRRVGLIA